MDRATGCETQGQAWPARLPAKPGTQGWPRGGWLRAAERDAMYAAAWAQVQADTAELLARGGPSSSTECFVMLVTVPNASCPFVRWLERQGEGSPSPDGSWSVGMHHGDAFSCGLYAAGMSALASYSGSLRLQMLRLLN